MSRLYGEVMHIALQSMFIQYIQYDQICIIKGETTVELNISM